MKFQRQVRSKWCGWQAFLWMALALACLKPAAAGAEAASDERAVAVTRTVLGIVGYTRWPAGPASVRICVLGEPEHAEDLLQNGNQMVGSQQVQVHRVALDDEKALNGCEGIYAGPLEEGVWHGLMRQFAGRSVLTISERGELCRIGAMFCLRHRGDGAGFEVNLDSVARSGLRVNPKVLQLARHKTAP
ncbi:YfiR family protein [Comamonas composti]|uniref:YfiR family protein n=1 Tax=Comamonas composti TaxID=408558 RepID=UPI000412C2E5|nr:YfiR family protein [Comamonas composti]